MRYEIEIRSGKRPEVIEPATVDAFSVADACREARELLRKRDGEVWIRRDGPFVTQRVAEHMERKGVQL